MVKETLLICYERQKLVVFSFFTVIEFHWKSRSMFRSYFLRCCFWNQIECFFGYLSTYTTWWIDLIACKVYYYFKLIIFKLWLVISFCMEEKNLVFACFKTNFVAQNKHILLDIDGVERFPKMHSSWINRPVYYYCWL